MKKVELELIKKIDNICRDNDIKYSLMDGSLLGAVRHKGFIPWDDDIDIMLPRPDFLKLRQILLNNGCENVIYMDFSTQKDCHYYYGKICDSRTILEERDIYKVSNYGVFIDVFIIDGLPSDLKEMKHHMKKIGRLRNLKRYAIHTKLSKMNKLISFLYKVLSIPIKMYGYRRINRKTDKLMTKYDYNESKYVTLLYNDISINKGKYYDKEFFNKTHYTKFEDTELPIIDNYDKYLKDLFGNYMEYPPIEKRCTNHYFDKLEWK